MEWYKNFLINYLLCEKCMSFKFKIQVISPEYFINHIENVPIHLYYSESDWLATSADVEGHLIKWLKPEILVGVHKLKDFNHNDFLWGMRAADEVYWPIINEIQQDTFDGFDKETRDSSNNFMMINKTLQENGKMDGNI